MAAFLRDRAKAIRVISHYLWGMWYICCYTDHECNFAST